MVQHENSSPWFDSVSKIEVEYFSNIEEAAKAEIHAVINENPKYNKVRFISENEKKNYIETVMTKYKKSHHPLVAEAIRHCGGTRFFCEAIGISRQALDNWKGEVPELRKYQIKEIMSSTEPSKDFKMRRPKSQNYEAGI